MKRTTEADNSPTPEGTEVEQTAPDLTEIPDLDQVQKEEEKKFTVRLTVYYVGRESSRINLGEQSIQQAQHTLAILNAPFDTLATSKSLFLTDVKGVTHLINTANVTHIEVETE